MKELKDNGNCLNLNLSTNPPGKTTRLKGEKKPPFLTNVFSMRKGKP